MAVFGDFWRVYRHFTARAGGLGLVDRNLCGLRFSFGFYGGGFLEQMGWILGSF
jgi:hypothetical protein